MILERWQIDWEVYVSCCVYIYEKKALKQVWSLPFSEQQRCRQWMNLFPYFRSVKFAEILIFHPNMERKILKNAPVISEQDFIFQKSYGCPQTLMLTNLLCPSDRLKPCRADNHKRTIFWKGAVSRGLLLFQLWVTIHLMITNVLRFIHFLVWLFLRGRRLHAFSH